MACLKRVCTALRHQVLGKLLGNQFGCVLNRYPQQILTLLFDQFDGLGTGRRSMLFHSTDPMAF
jgi:hypothetical protein